MARVRYDKLVRDGIPEKIAQNGDTCEVRPLADDAEFERELRKKVVEEAGELVQTESREEFLKEYADLMIVLDALTRLKEFSEADIKTAIEENVLRKGKFDERHFLHWSEHNDT